MCTIDTVLELLKNQGKTQKQLCDYIGIGKQTFSNWKSGISSSYNKYLYQIANFFNVSVDYLLKDKKSTEKGPPFSSESLKEYVVFHRDGKNVKVKFTPEQQKIFDALVASTKIEDVDE